MYRLKKDFKHLTIIINNSIQSIQEIKLYLKKTDGIMIERAVFKNTLLLSQIDPRMFNNKKQHYYQKYYI